MSNHKEVVKGVPIGNLLYTTEADASKRKTQAELNQPDPAPERALGVLAGTPTPNTKEDTKNESPIS